jgi:aspartyl-tRNA(Asn)/glutamyl-tRNA(Gln) amidotransferase subunit B
MISSQDRAKVSFHDAAIVVGLEVHVQLKTASKLFCGCSTKFGAAPNTQTCPICTGMPGALPVLNEQAIRLAIRTGLALHCHVARYTKWDRKNYFYPDLPKGYQTSQFDQPICTGGYLDVSDIKGSFEPVRVRLERAHLEEDAGKSMHDESQRGGVSKIDLNRAGTPLLEIVTKPDLRSATQAKAFLQELRLILLYLNVSDGNMQEGSLRCDANVNLRISTGGETIATPIAEIKNLNSFRSVERAIQAEARRQFEVWQARGLTINDAPKQTRGWNDSAQETYLQREKEDSADYRYFPCPDLIAYCPSEAQLDTIREELGQLPADLRHELQHQLGVKPYDADVIVSQGRGVVDYYFRLIEQLERLAEQTLGKVDRLELSRLAANWVGQEVLRYLNETNLTIEQFPLPVGALAELLMLIRDGSLDQSRGKEVFNEMLAHSISLSETIARLGIVSVDSGEIKRLASQLMNDNPSIIDQIRAGNAKAIGALIGQAKKINPNANPGLVKDEILRLMDD